MWRVLGVAVEVKQVYTPLVVFPYLTGATLGVPLLLLLLVALVKVAT